MTKKELASYIADLNDVSQTSSAESIDMVVKAMRIALEAGEEVTIRGFGSFKPVQSAPRSGRNLRTKERVVIPSKTRIKFKSYMLEAEIGEEIAD